MLHYIRIRREILHAKVEMARVTVKDGNGRVLATFAKPMDEDPLIVLRKAGLYLMAGGSGGVTGLSASYHILVRRRWFGETL